MLKINVQKFVVLSVMFTLLISAIGASPTPVRADGIIYVDITAGVAGDGSSWANAFRYLQDGLAAAESGDQIWVANGLYVPDKGVGITNDDRTNSFTLIDGVEIYGGFAGTETLLSERNITANPTILSGDIDENDINTDGNTIAETTADIAGSNSYHVVEGGGATAAAVLDGFIITAGDADNPSVFDQSGGGGMFNWSASPTLRNLTFTGNYGSVGGGMYNYNTAAPAITDSTFSGNHAENGGGMYNSLASPVIEDVTFSNNTATTSAGGMQTSSGSAVLTNVLFTENTASFGGGVVDSNSTSTYTNVTFTNNSASNSGGGGMLVSLGSPVINSSVFDNNEATTSSGGGVNVIAGNPTFTNVTFINNSAENGGGLGNNSNSTLALANVTFANNSADNTAGGFYNGGGSTATLTNVTISENSAGLNGAGIYSLGGTVTLINTIVANNTGAGDCYLGGGTIGAASSNNLIESTGTDACGLVDGTNDNIIGSDPDLGTLTGSPAYFPLNPDSPAMDAGDNTACAAAPVNNTSQNELARPQGITCDIGSTETLIPTVTLTVYSTGANDGWIRELNETSNTGNTINNTATTLSLGDDGSDRQYRVILHFDTSALPDTAVITSAVMKLKQHSISGDNPFSILGTLRADMRVPDFGAATLEPSDFAASAARNNVAVFNVTPVNNWYSGTINSTRLSYINLSGTTQFKLYFTTDDNDDLGSDLIKFFSGDASNSATHPNLVIQYYVP